MIDMTPSGMLDSLDLSMFSDQDILNTVLQRSEVLHDLDRPGKLIRQWSKGNPELLQNEVSKRGPELLRRAISILYLEYLELKPALDRLKPKKLVDIGCGYAFIDLFIARDYNSSITLIDLEENGATHFGFQAEGAAYSNLAVAKKFLTANGTSSRKIKTINPREDDLSSVKNVDLAMSLLSCGFHYSVRTYDEFWRGNVKSDGAIILDLRSNKAEGQLGEMIKIGAVSEITSGDKWQRVLVQKAKSSNCLTSALVGQN